MLKTVILACFVSLSVSSKNLCDITLDGGICLFGSETVLMPAAPQDNLVGY